MSRPTSLDEILGSFQIDTYMTSRTRAREKAKKAIREAIERIIGADEHVPDELVLMDDDTPRKYWQNELRDAQRQRAADFAGTDTQPCARCDHPITDWSAAVKDADGYPVCGACHEGAIDQAQDEMQEAA